MIRYGVRSPDRVIEFSVLVPTDDVVDIVSILNMWRNPVHSVPLSTVGFFLSDLAEDYFFLGGTWLADCSLF